MTAGAYFNVENNEVKSWPQNTLGQSASAASNSRMISKLLELNTRINALRLTSVGLCCELYNSFPVSTGTELMERAAETSASFARLQIELEGLLTTVRAAQKAASQQTTLEAGSKPSN